MRQNGLNSSRDCPVVNAPYLTAMHGTRPLLDPLRDRRGNGRMRKARSVDGETVDVSLVDAGQTDCRTYTPRLQADAGIRQYDVLRSAHDESIGTALAIDVKCRQACKLIVLERDDIITAAGLDSQAGGRDVEDETFETRTLRLNRELVGSRSLDTDLVGGRRNGYHEVGGWGVAGDRLKTGKYYCLTIEDNAARI